MNIIKNLLPFLFLGLSLSSCGGGSGGDSSPVTDPINQTILPVSPDTLAAQVISDSQINISWTDNSNNETSFLIERKSGVSTSFSLIATVSQNIVIYSDTSLTQSTSYTYRVRATNSTGNSTYTNEIIAITSSSSGGGAIPSTSLDKNYGLDFDASAGADGFTRHNGAAWTGSGNDSAQDSVVDADGNIFVVGISQHSNADNSYDMMLLKLNTVGVADTNFGNDYNLDGKPDGYILFDRDGLHRHDIGYKILLDSNGKILITGYQGATGNYSLILWRYNQNGQIDTSFGGDYNNDNISDGYVIHSRDDIDISVTYSSEIASSMALDSTGRIVVVGNTNVNGWKDLIIWRFTTNGVIDSSFGEDYSGDNIADGFFVHDGAAGLTGKNDTATDIIIDSNQQPVVTGYSTNSNNNWDMLIWRFTTNGILDTSFGGDYDADTFADGFMIHNDAAGGNSFDIGGSIAEDINGNYLVGGYSYSSNAKPVMALWRITKDGLLDINFGEDYDSDNVLDGYTTHSSAAGGTLGDGAYDIAIDGTKIVLVGYSDNVDGNQDTVVWRYTSSGILDSTFGLDYNNDNIADGFIVHGNAAFGNGRDLARSITLAGGNYIVSGMSTNIDGNGDLSVWKFSPIGELMTSSFGRAYDNIVGADGYFLLDGAAWGSGNDEANAMFATPNGDVYIAGYSEHPEGDLDIVVWHYTPTGLLDTTFGGDYNNDGVADGYVTSRRSLGDDKALAITIDNANRIVVAGYTTATLRKPDVAVWRFTLEGKIDHSFGKDNNSDGLLDGYVLHDGAAGRYGGEDAGYAISTDTNNNIIVAGYSSNTTGSNNTDMAVWKFNEVGELDTTFGGDRDNDTIPDGFVVFDGTTEGFYQNQGFDIVIDNTDGIIVSGFASKVSSGRQDMALWRFTTSGLLDANFGANGYVLHDGAASGISGNDVGQSIAIDTSTNKLLVTGYSINSNNNTDMVLWRFNSNGALDTSFGIDNDNSGNTDGFIVMPSEGNAAGYSLVVKPSGDITVAGKTTNVSKTTDITLWQFTTSGQLKTSFGGDYNNDGFADGYFISENMYGAAGNSSAADIYIDDLNRVLVCGTTTNWMKNSDLSLLRYIQ